MEEVIMSVAQMEKAFAAWPHVGPALHVPKDESEYRDLVALLDRLIDLVGEDEGHSLATMMEVVGVLVERYEDEHVPELA